ncbi:hypothetical protein [Moorena producens]
MITSEVDRIFPHSPLPTSETQTKQTLSLLPTPYSLLPTPFNFDSNFVI